MFATELLDAGVELSPSGRRDLQGTRGITAELSKDVAFCCLYGEEKHAYLCVRA
jgi:hypothetical protein